MVVKLAGLAIFAVVPHQGNRPSNLRIVGRHRPAIAEATEELEGVEAEASGDPERPRHLVSISRTQRLRCVFDDVQIMLLGDLNHPVHVAHAAVEMNRNDRSRSPGNRTLERVHVHIVIAAHLHQARRGARVNDRRNGCRESMSDGDHLVARADPRGEQGEGQGVVATAYAHRMANPHESSQVRFKIAQLATHDQIALGETFMNGAVNSHAIATVVLSWIDERNSIAQFSPRVRSCRKYSSTRARAILRRCTPLRTMGSTSWPSVGWMWVSLLLPS